MNLGFAKGLDRVVGRRAARLLGGLDALRSLGRPPAPVGRVRRVLVTKFWGIGNWALLRPVVRDLRERWSDARFVVATLGGNEALVADLADEMLLVDARGAGRACADLLGAVRALRRRPCDLAVDFEPFACSGALLARLGGCAQRVGFRSGDAGRDALYTVTVPFRADAHASRSFRDLAEAAGVPPGRYVPGGLPTDPAGQAEARRLAGARPYVVIHPGSGDNFPGRRWSASGFAALGRTAWALGRRVLVTGDAREADLAGSVAAAVGEGAANLAGRLSLPGLVALLAGADALASNDTGPVHVASQVGTPVLAFYGPNTPRLYGPLSAGSRALYRDLPCSPCLTAANHRSSRCRIYSCMAAISTGAAVTAWRRMLAVRRAAPTAPVTPERGTPERGTPGRGA